MRRAAISPQTDAPSKDEGVDGSAPSPARQKSSVHLKDLPCRPRMAITAGEYLTAVDGQMKLQGLTHLTNVVNSVGYTAGTLRAMDDDSLIRLLGADRVDRLVCGLVH